MVDGFVLMLTGDAEGKKKGNREREREVEMGKGQSLQRCGVEIRIGYSILCDHLTFFLFIHFSILKMNLFLGNQKFNFPFIYTFF